MTTPSELTAEYQIWTAANGYPEAGSADELRCDVLSIHDEAADTVKKTATNADWLSDFITRWEDAQEAEDTSDQQRREWAAARIWCADFDAAGLPHARDGDLTRIGYAYPAGCYIKDAGNGTYWTIADRGDIIGTLAECERFLWENHAKHELANG